MDNLTFNISGLYGACVLQAARTNKWIRQDGTPSPRAFLRGEQLFRLELVLFEHRKAFASEWEQLKGKKALHHKLLTEYKWTPQQIEKLSMPQILLALQGDLKNVHIPEGAGLADLVIPESDLPLPELTPCSEEEWDPLLSEKYLTVQIV